jgi:hypothetical protein
MSITPVQSKQTGNALNRLVNREEVLQICYWYQGEGFGDVYSAGILSPFLNCDAEAIDAALQELVAEGRLETASGPMPAYRFTAEGKKQGCRLFAEGFSDYQKQGHGECPDGCCDGDDHSQCGDDCILH